MLPRLHPKLEFWKNIFDLKTVTQFRPSFNFERVLVQEHFSEHGYADRGNICNSTFIFLHSRHSKRCDSERELFFHRLILVAGSFNVSSMVWTIEQFGLTSSQTKNAIFVIASCKEKRFCHYFKVNVRF